MIQPETPSTVCARCSETRWSLLWGSRCRRLRPTPTSGTRLRHVCHVSWSSGVSDAWRNVVVLCCSEAYGLQQLYQQTQERLQARRDALQSGSPPARPVMDGDVTTMAVKFERSVNTTRVQPAAETVCDVKSVCDQTLTSGHEKQ